MKYVALMANIFSVVWLLAMLVSSTTTGKTGIILKASGLIALGGLPFAFLSFAVGGIYYGVHILGNKRLTMISKVFWLLSPAFCFVPYFFYWSKYVKDE